MCKASLELPSSKHSDSILSLLWQKFLMWGVLFLQGLQNVCMCLKKKKKNDFGGGKMKFSSPGCATTVLKLWWRKRRNMKQKRHEAFLIIAVALASSASRLLFFPIANFLKFMIFLQSVMIDCSWSSRNCCVCNNTSVCVLLSLSMPTTVAWWVMVLPSFCHHSFIHSFILLLLLSFFLSFFLSSKSAVTWIQQLQENCWRIPSSPPFLQLSPPRKQLDGSISFSLGTPFLNPKNKNTVSLLQHKQRMNALHTSFSSSSSSSKVSLNLWSSMCQWQQEPRHNLLSS